VGLPAASSPSRLSCRLTLPSVGHGPLAAEDLILAASAITGTINRYLSV